MSYNVRQLYVSSVPQVKYYASETQILPNVVIEQRVHIVLKVREHIIGFGKKYSAITQSAELSLKLTTLISFFFCIGIGQINISLFLWASL